MFRVDMSFDNGQTWYPYGRYTTEDRANEVAYDVREERGCWVQVVYC